MTYRVTNLTDYFARPDHVSRKNPYGTDPVQAFRDRYQLWVFDYAGQLAVGGTKGNAGFAILSLLNAYIDVIGRLQGDFPYFPYKDEGGNPIWNRDCIETGLRKIFPELDNQPKVVDLLRDSLRNSVAHLGLTGDNIALDHEPYLKPFVYDFDDSGQALVVINPIRWYFHLQYHFDRYVESLNENSEEETERQRRFRERHNALDRVGTRAKDDN